MGAATISVLMAAYNAERYIAKAITSVIRQSFLDWELIIVDDGSDDWTSEIASQYSDPRIRIFKLLENRGKIEAMKLGLAQCQGEYILEMDSDDWLNEDSLQSLYERMKEQPSAVGMIYGDRLVYRELRGVFVYSHTLNSRQIDSMYEMLCLLTAVGPRFYRQECLQEIGAWQTEPWGDGRLYEDISVILRMMERYKIKYIGYTGYNVTKHLTNITRLNSNKWWSTMKRLVKYFLERWGSEYKPSFSEKRHKVYLIKQENKNTRE